MKIFCIKLCCSYNKNLERIYSLTQSLLLEFSSKRRNNFVCMFVCVYLYVFILGRSGHLLIFVNVQKKGYTKY
jgi:hypothetical protein